MASASIVLPAPVSPVSTFRPAAGSRSARSISARLSMWRRSSTRPSMGRGPDEPVFVLVGERLEVAPEERRAPDPGEGGAVGRLAHVEVATGLYTRGRVAVDDHL